jgi:hypothetical protein
MKTGVKLKRDASNSAAGGGGGPTIIVDARQSSSVTTTGQTTGVIMPNKYGRLNINAAGSGMDY